MLPHAATKSPTRREDTSYHDRPNPEPLREADGAVAPLTQSSTVRGSVSVDTLAERSYARLRYALIVGQLTPGERTTLGSLARRLGTSITPVRDALSRLTAADALYQNRQSGVIIPVLGHADLEELRRLRLAVEGFAFVSAAPHHRAPDWRGFKVLQADVCRAAERDDPAGFAAAVWSLRAALLELARPSVLAMLAERIWCRFGPTFTQMAADAERRRQIACHLGKIVTAIGNRDLEEARTAILDEIDAGTVPRSSNIADDLTAPPIAPICTMTCSMLAPDGKSGGDHV